MVKQMEGMNIKLEGKEMAKLERLADKNRKLSKYSNDTQNNVLTLSIFIREEFVSYGKHSVCVREYVDKAVKEHKSNRAAVKTDTVKIDKAVAAFKVGEGRDDPYTMFCVFFSP